MMDEKEAAQLVLSALKEAVGEALKEYLELERKKSMELERIANALEHYNAQKFHTV